MVRFLFIGLILIILIVPGESLGSVSPGLAFLQARTTAARPVVVPGVVGVPGSEPVRPQESIQQSPPAQAPGGSQQAPAQPAAQPPAQPPAQPARIGGQSSRGSSGGIGFTFNNAPIDTVISTIMRELGYSYVIDPKVTGTVNLFTMRDIPKNRMFEILEQVLKMNGQGIVKQNDMYVIAPLADGPRQPHGIILKKQEEKAPDKGGTGGKATPPTGGQSSSASPGSTAVPIPSGLSEEEGVVTYVIPLHYLASEHMKQLAQVFVSDGANVVDFAPANILMVTDHRKNIQQILDIVEMLDTNYFSINTVDLIPIKNNLAKDVAEDLGKVFAPGEKSSVRLVAIERLNSVLVVTHAPSVLQQVKDWINKLDSPSASTNIKTFVYQVENNTAINIADVLGQLYQDGTGLPSSATGEVREGQPGGAQGTGRQTEAGFIPGQPNYNQMFNQGGQRGIRSELGPSLTGRPMQSQQGVRAIVAGNVKVIVNEFNNSLIVQATQADYDFLLETIRQLDVLPRQVLIEAKVYSVTLQDDLLFGVTAFLEAQGISGTDPVPATTGSIAATGNFAGTTRTMIGMSRQLEVSIVDALRKKTNVEMMEAPRLLAMDGMQATFNVGSEVPVTTASFGNPIQSGTSNAFVNSIQYRPTGTTLLIVPRISASGIVTMDLAVEISASSGDGVTPTIERSYVETSMIVRDGQTVAIAGIISDSYNHTRNRVPILGDIPIMGALFGSTRRDKRRAELVILVTPHVIPNLPTAVELTADFRRALRNAYKFINKKETEDRDLIQQRRDQELREFQKEQERQQEELRKQLERRQKQEQKATEPPAPSTAPTQPPAQPQEPPKP